MPKTQRVWLILCACLLAALLPLAAHAQTSNGLDLDRLKASQGSSSGLSALLTGEPTANGDVVNPRTYMVGPGDVLSYQTTGLDYLEKVTIITPENTVVLERFGTLSCNGLTLQQLRDSLAQFVQKRSPNVQFSMSLRRARLVFATLSGNVAYPGTYMVPASMRVSTFLAVTRQPGLLGKSSEPVDQGRSKSRVRTMPEGMRATPPLSAFAVRNIIVRHRTGISTADLPKSLIVGFEHLDPHLREGDEVIVPYDEVDYPIVSVAGAVGNPVSIAYREGDRASVLLSAGGGPTTEADLSSITLVDGNGSLRTTLSVDSSWQLTGEDPLLSAGSTIVVERKVLAGQSSRQGIVELHGEIERIGVQVIVPGVTRLREVIERAGGIKKEGALSLAYVMRPAEGATTINADRQASLRRFLYSNLTLEDTVRYFLDQQFRFPFVSCDFNKAFADSNSLDNIRLQNGDIIAVPRIPDRIYVYGQVTQPGFVGYMSGRTLEWYVDRAGGYASGAKPGRAMVIRGKSKVSVVDEEAIVEAGDEVYVPRKPDVPAGTELQMYAIIAGILATIVAVAGTVISILR
ncbi:MAG: SLBB domain-containing protein [bacterium]|nr:SLBB domain-containing protein [bacterium]